MLAAATIKLYRITKLPLVLPRTPCVHAGNSQTAAILGRALLPHHTRCGSSATYKKRDSCGVPGGHAAHAVAHRSLHNTADFQLHTCVQERKLDAKSVPHQRIHQEPGMLSRTFNN